MKSSKSLLVFILCCLFLLGSPFLARKWDRPGSQAVIVWDVCGYWLYLPSFFYDDLGELHNYDHLIDTYSPSNKDHAFINPHTGKYVMNYPCGQAIMYLPAFAAGHVYCKLTAYPADGLSLPYQVALAFWAVLVSCIGLWFLRLLLLRYFDDWLVALILVILCGASNYYNYASFSALTHTFLFTLYALILLLTDSFYRDQRCRLWRMVLIGLLSGLATITRPTEIICVLIPLLWGVGNISDLKARISFFLRQISVPVLYVGAAFVAALPQLVYWKVYAGRWIFFSYHGDDKTFSFLHPHILNVLISYRKGWLMYTPVMLLAIFGFHQLYKCYRRVFWAITIFSAINLYLISSWDCWWYGGSFSMRPMIQSYPLLVFPMAAFLNVFLRQKYLRYPVILFLIFCVWLNMLMTYQANAGGIIDPEGMNKAYYWRVFGKMHIAPDDRKLLDTQEEMPKSLTGSLKLIYHSDLYNARQQDSRAYHEGKYVVRIDSNNKGTPKMSIPIDAHMKGWYRASVDAYFPVKEWQVWSQTLCVISFNKGEKEIKTNVMRLQRIMDQNEWRRVYIDIAPPHQGDYDSLVIYFWNGDGDKAIYLSDFTVSYTSGD